MERERREGEGFGEWLGEVDEGWRRGQWERVFHDCWRWWIYCHRIVREGILEVIMVEYGGSWIRRACDVMLWRPFVMR